jgi:hypothetical protein
MRMEKKKGQNTIMRMEKKKGENNNENGKEERREQE